MKVTAFEILRGHTMSFNAEVTRKDLATLTALVTVATIMNPSDVMAASADITEKVERASKPIKDLLIGLADPVCYIVFTWGLLEAMLGKGASGLTRMKYASLGYMGMNWLPVFMQIMREAKP